MKRFSIPLLLTLASFAGVTGCGRERHYEIYSFSVVPDTLRDDCAKCIADVMSGASNHLTTSDYEDVDDAIKQARYSCERAYSQELAGLALTCEDGVVHKFVRPEAMTRSEHRILDSLLTH